MLVRLLLAIGFAVAGSTAGSAQTCTNVNNLIVCDNGTVGNRFGSTVYWSDGTSSTGVPRTTFVNPQSTPRLGSEPAGPVDQRVDQSGSDAPSTTRWPSLGR